MEKPNVQIEYRVLETTRYTVTRFHQSEDGRQSGCETRGEFDNATNAYDVAYALCKLEHDQKGWEPGDMRIRYPEVPHGAMPTQFIP